MKCKLRKTKRIASLLVLSAMVVTTAIPVEFLYAQSSKASDIETHWAKKEISSWVERGLIKGYPDGTFKPNNGITRAEFAALVNRSFRFEDKADISFSDTKENDWFYSEIAKAKKAGYLDGYKDGTLKPNAAITRQEVATVIARLKSLQENTSVTEKFVDKSSIPSWSKGFIGAVVKANYMKGYPNGKFEPAKNISRAESVVALNNLMGVKIIEIGEQKVAVNNTINIAVKTDPTDAVVSIQNSDEKILKATLNGNNIELKGLNSGYSTVTVTARKDGLQDGVISFKVVVGSVTYSGGGGGGGSISTNNKPVIKVVEPDGTNDGVITLKVGDEFKTPTVTASDYEDGDITSKIVKTGEDKVDTTKTGEYTLTYNVKDTQQLSADESKIVVKVIKAEKTDETANISVDVAEAMPTFKNISVNSSTVGSKFKVEGSSLIKAFGEKITINTSGTTAVVSILDTNGNILGTMTVDVGSDITKSFSFKAQKPDAANASANITVDVAEAMPTFKNITVNSSTVGNKFKVEGSTLIKAFDEKITIITSGTTAVVSILDASGNVLGTITVDVNSDSTKSYTFKTNGGSSTNNKPVITVVEPDGVNDGVITLAISANFVPPTVTANDTEDGNITSRIVKVGEDKVDTTKQGEYVLTYNVTDLQNLSANECKVTVKVLSIIPQPKNAKITVDVAEAMPAFKNITVNSSNIGTKFKVEGSTLIKAFGEKITITTSETTRTVSILDDNGNLQGTITVNVASDSTGDYIFQ